MDKNNKKELTLSDISELLKENNKALETKIEESAKKTTEILATKIEESAEKLATMTQNQFLELGEKLTNVERKIDNIEAELNKKVEKIGYNTLKYRVEKLEEKFA